MEDLWNKYSLPELFSGNDTRMLREMRNFGLYEEHNYEMLRLSHLPSDGPSPGPFYMHQRPDALCYTPDSTTTNSGSGATFSSSSPSLDCYVPTRCGETDAVLSQFSPKSIGETTETTLYEIDESPDMSLGGRYGDEDNVEANIPLGRTKHIIPPEIKEPNEQQKKVTMELRDMEQHQVNQVLSLLFSSNSMVEVKISRPN